MRYPEHVVPDGEEEYSSTAVQDDTDLTTLVGRESKFHQKLVSKCFTDRDDGNVTWEAAKTFTANQKVSVIPWGAKKRLQRFFEKVAGEPCFAHNGFDGRAFNATWKPGEGSSPYLGSGAFGDVYRTEVNGSVQALKVSMKGPIKVEFDTLKGAAIDNAPLVTVFLEKHDENEFSAYTMEPVGTLRETRGRMCLLFSLHVMICP